jgi:hypothetical protein
MVNDPGNDSETTPAGAARRSKAGLENHQLSAPTVELKLTESNTAGHRRKVLGPVAARPSRRPK